MQSRHSVPGRMKVSQNLVARYLTPEGALRHAKGRMRAWNCHRSRAFVSQDR